ncbi:MAG: RNA-binding cell elongation regulator Jag/EloR [Clostridia bacterium]|nr:RNA-binding cell elongation regulator Jag/EloR [Clostridia bacterium]
MLKKVEKTAKSVNEAVELAAAELGVSKDEVSYTVTREIGKGLMKFLVGSEVDIVAWRTADEAAEAKIKADKPVSKKVPKPEKSVSEKIEKTPAPAPAKPEVDDSFVIPKSAVDDAKYFVSEVLTKIGLKFDLHIKLDKNVINIDISGEKMGLLIGKRGDTIDAVQMLTILYVNRNKNMPYVKVNLDTENYRTKREATLVRLAHGLERSVLKDKKSITLEPMTANERRIIHSALQNNPKIKTYSVGEEPNRRMIISLNKPETEEK